MDRSLPVLLKRFSPANDLQTLSVQFTEIARAALYGGYFRYRILFPQRRNRWDT